MLFEIWEQLFQYFYNSVRYWSLCALFLTSSAVSLMAHGHYGTCGLEGAPLRFARSYSLRLGGPILPYSLRSERPSGVGQTDTRTHKHCSLYRRCFVKWGVFYFRHRKHEDTDYWSGWTRFFFATLMLIAETLLLGALALVLYWVLQYRGGFAWNEKERIHLEFNFHPVLMTGGFIFFLGQGKLKHFFKNGPNLRNISQYLLFPKVNPLKLQLFSRILGRNDLLHICITKSVVISEEGFKQP